MATETTPAISEARAPQTMREKTSRPSSSVPNQNSAEGALRMVAKLGLIGIVAARSAGPTMATRTKNSTRPAPRSGAAVAQKLGQDAAALLRQRDVFGDGDGHWACLRRGLTRT